MNSWMFCSLPSTFPNLLKQWSQRPANMSKLLNSITLLQPLFRRSYPWGMWNCRPSSFWKLSWLPKVSWFYSSLPNHIFSSLHDSSSYSNCLNTKCLPGNCPWLSSLFSLSDSFSVSFMKIPPKPLSLVLTSLLTYFLNSSLETLL